MGDQGGVTGGLFLFVAAFLGTGVEMVEAMTIILATGITRGWRSTFLGAQAAAVILVVVVLVFGLALKDLPLAPLRIVVGTFLLIFGLQWLRKAVLRSGGVLAYHDEAKIYERRVRALQIDSAGATGRRAEKIDWQAFVVAFKGVLLEGLEAVFIVVTFGLSARSSTLLGLSGVGLAAAAAVLALVIVLIAAALAHRPLSTVPENKMKTVVGLLLAAFGTFWAGEGVGVSWPLEDLTILVLLAFYSVVTYVLVARLRTVRNANRAGVGVINS